MSEEINFTVEPAFATPIYHTTTEAYLNKNQSIIKEHLNKVQPNVGRNVTTLDHYILDNSNMSDLKGWFQSQVDNYAYQILGIKKSIKFYITQSWLNINPPTSEHHGHFHRNSLFSGVYYLKGNTPIIFERLSDWTQHFEFEFEKPTIFSGENFHVSPTPGTLLLFPSTLRHSVPPNGDEDIRVSLAFNVFFKGELQPTKDNLTRLKI